MAFGENKASLCSLPARRSACCVTLAGLTCPNIVQIFLPIRCIAIKTPSTPHHCGHSFFASTQAFTTINSEGFWQQAAVRSYGDRNIFSVAGGNCCTCTLLPSSMVAAHDPAESFLPTRVTTPIRCEPVRVLLLSLLSEIFYFYARTNLSVRRSESAQTGRIAGAVSLITPASRLFLRSQQNSRRSSRGGSFCRHGGCFIDGDKGIF